MQYANSENEKKALDNLLDIDVQNIFNTADVPIFDDDIERK